MVRNSRFSFHCLKECFTGNEINRAVVIVNHPLLTSLTRSLGSEL